MAQQTHAVEKKVAEERLEAAKDLISNLNEQLKRLSLEKASLVEAAGKAEYYKGKLEVLQEAQSNEANNKAWMQEIIQKAASARKKQR